MKLSRYLLIAIAGLVIFSCYPEPDAKRLYDELVVATNRDPSANFTSYSTYAIPTDTVGLISNTDPNDTLITTAGGSGFPRPVIEAIRNAMDARGYARVSHTESPDLGIHAVVVNDFNVFQQVVYPDPYYYPGGYYSGYYGYNSWSYYPYINTYAYQKAVLVIEIVDLKNRTPDNKVKVIWNAYMGDLYGAISPIEQTQRAIEQAFEQSPYFQKAL